MSAQERYGSIDGSLWPLGRANEIDGVPSEDFTPYTCAKRRLSDTPRAFGDINPSNVSACKIGPLHSNQSSSDLSDEDTPTTTQCNEQLNVSHSTPNTRGEPADDYYINLFQTLSQRRKPRNKVVECLASLILHRADLLLTDPVLCSLIASLASVNKLLPYSSCTHLLHFALVLMISLRLANKFDSVVRRTEPKQLSLSVPGSSIPQRLKLTS